MRNRNERLIAHDSRTSARCDWQWTSDLHLAKVFPALGRLLMKRALHDWPIALQAAPISNNTNLQLSFVIGHRGLERLPHLLLTLQSIAAQRGVSFECIVVEQSAVPELQDQLPSWVRHIHTPLPYDNMPYSRSWAFNVGVGCAKADTVILHDNDMLVPMDYGRQVVARTADGFDAMNLKRFVFYLGQAHSAAVFAGKESLEQHPPREVVQNLEAGGSLAITREAYFSIGGFDESFVGWGGEDNEFWERAQTLKLWAYGFLPLVHLWHKPQPEKCAENRPTTDLLERLSSIGAENRIKELRERNFSNLCVGAGLGSPQAKHLIRPT